MYICLKLGGIYSYRSRLGMVIIIINTVLIRFYPCKRGWPDLPHSASNLSHSHSPSRSILCILLLQTNTLTLLPDLHVFLSHPRFLFPFTSNSNAFLKTWPWYGIYNYLIVNKLLLSLVKTFLFYKYLLLK